MIKRLVSLLAMFSLAFVAAHARVGRRVSATRSTSSRRATESSAFFKTAYGYAVFPTIGKGAVGVGGAYGKGRVYAEGQSTSATRR